MTLPQRFPVIRQVHRAPSCVCTPAPANSWVPGGSSNVQPLGILMGPSNSRIGVAFCLTQEKLRKVKTTNVHVKKTRRRDSLMKRCADSQGRAVLGCSPQGAVNFCPWLWHVYTVLSTQRRRCYLLLPGVKVHCEMPLVSTGFRNTGIRWGEGKLKGASPGHLNPDNSLRKSFYHFSGDKLKQRDQVFWPRSDSHSMRSRIRFLLWPSLGFCLWSNIPRKLKWNWWWCAQLRLDVLSKAQSLGFLWGIIQKLKPVTSRSVGAYHWARPYVDG